MPDEPEVREQWGRQVEFVLTMIGYAVGLGNVWRFPYLCFQNGGGAFLIPYVVCLVFLGIPMFALECAFGQFGGKGPLSIWSMNPTFKGLGMSMIAASGIVFIYYNIIIAWALRFLVASFTLDDLPWKNCNDCSCLLYNVRNVTEEMVASLRYNNTLGVPCLNITWNETARSPSELFYENEILHDSGSLAEIGDVQWPLVVANLFAYMVIFLVLIKGIQTLGKVVYFTAIFPYILMTIILVNCALLPGAADGIKFYLEPDFSKLKDAKVWSDAAVQIFFSLSACMGGLIAMSSYNKFSNNILRDAFVIPVINCATSFFAGFVVFSTLGFMAHQKDLPVANVTKGGPGLAFVVYPEAISQMEVPTLWAILFFFMICILGFSTQFSAAETLMTSIIDEFPSFFKSRSRQLLFRFGVCISAFIMGIPMTTEGGNYLLSLVDEAVLGFPLLLIGLFEYISIVHIYGYSNFAADIRSMIGFSPYIYFRICWQVLSPLLLVGVISFKAYQMETFETTTEAVLYYLTMTFVVIWIPAYYVWYSCQNSLGKLMRPKSSWMQRRTLSDHQTRVGDMRYPETLTLHSARTPGANGDEAHDNRAFQPDYGVSPTSPPMDISLTSADPPTYAKVVNEKGTAF